jgi:cardiolipin synthase
VKTPRTAAARLWASWRARLVGFGRYAKTPFRDGNLVTVYPDGGAALAATRALLRAARRAVDVEMYAWADDVVGRELADLAGAAVERGVRVRVLYDAVGSWGSTAHLVALAARGARVVAFHPVAPWRMSGNPNHRNHRKLLLVDDSAALLGSANWAAEYDSALPDARTRDVGVGLAGPVVADLALDFRDAWRLATGEVLEPATPAAEGEAPPLPGPPPFRAPVQMVSGLVRGDASAIRRLYGFVLGAARHEVLIANPYFIPGPRLLRSLRKAASRGLTVELLLAGETDQPLTQAASRATYARLLRSGVAIWERRGLLLHSKVALVDREVAALGSANLDSRSFRHNLELNVNVHHAGVTAALRGALEIDRANSVRIEPDAWLRRTFLERLWCRLAYLVRYWL